MRHTGGESANAERIRGGLTSPPESAMCANMPVSKDLVCIADPSTSQSAYATVDKVICQCAIFRVPVPPSNAQIIPSFVTTGHWSEIQDGPRESHIDAQRTRVMDNIFIDVEVLFVGHPTWP